MTDDAVAFAAEQAERQLFRDVAAQVRPLVADDSSGHGMDHLWRVFRLGMRLAHVEGADPEVVGIAALVHDVHRSMGDGTGVHPTESLDEVRARLDRAGVSGDRVDAVCHAVAVHDEYDYREETRPAETLEAEVLQDADNLDAIGAVGVARNFAFTGVHGNRLWAPDSDEPSGIDHAHDKLLKLRDEMNTEAGRRLAAERHRFLAEFVDRFEREWRGEL